MDKTDEERCGENRAAIMGKPEPNTLATLNEFGDLVFTSFPAGTTTCPETHFVCPGDGYCLPVYLRCNGVSDCPGREDEADCNGYTCPGFYRCRGFLGTCLHADHVCDGWPQCPQHDDERFCGLTCPENCTCVGHALFCHRNFPARLSERARYLDASDSGLKPFRLSKHTMLIHLSLANCDLTRLLYLTLPNLRSVDLSDNHLRVITAADLGGLMNLRVLFLSGNMLTSLFVLSHATTHSYPGLQTLDLSRVTVSYTHLTLPTNAEV